MSDVYIQGGGQALTDRLSERISVILPANLQPMQVLEKLDVEAILSARMIRLKQLWQYYDPPAAAQYDVEKLEFDPIKINQEACSYFELLVRDRVNQAARSITLAYAIGTDLDAIASRYPGGVPRLEGESDDRYRRRIWLSPNTLSPHGTAEAYEFWALTALPALRDVTAIRAVMHDYYPTILITCLMEPPAEPKPSDEQLVGIRAYIQSLSRMGLTDVISVNPPKIRETEYRINVWLYPGTAQDQTLNKIVANIATLVNDQYWLGHDHTHTAIHAACRITGVHHVDILEPKEDVFVALDWIVRVTKLTVTFAGRAL
ncbi:MAG TPA: baseplate J/gp47 family protein [Mesorhizobium sp.]|nr:baseplate J/gp47 family protein [Mesorhizobium sp.]